MGGMRIGTITRTLGLFLACWTVTGCQRVVGVDTAVVDADALRATLEARRGEPFLLVVFAGFDGGSDDVISATLAAAKPTEADSGAPALGVVLLGVDRLVVPTTDVAVAQAERKASSCHADGCELLVWAESDPVVLDGALPLEEGRRLSRRLPAVIGFDARGEVVEALTRDVSSAAIAELAGQLRSVAAEPPR